MRRLCTQLILASTVAHGQWYPQQNFPGSPRDEAAAFAVGTNIYLGTGTEDGVVPTNDWYRYDGLAAQWSTIAALPASARYDCSAFVLPYPDDGYGYVFGGIDADGPLNELWRYDPANDGWTQMTSLPAAPRHAAVAFNGGYIATGLLADGTATSELWRYDVTTDSWEQLTPIPGTPRHGACGMNGVGYMVVGGADPENNALSDCWSYNTLTDTWSACVSLPEGRYGSMCGLAAYDLLLTAGATDDTTIVETSFSYNQSSWLPMGDSYPGGTRRGGIMIEGGSGLPGLWHTYTGLGLSDDLQRHNDWYIISGAFSIGEYRSGRLAVHPNPSAGRVWLQLPDQWSRAQYAVRDALGRSVMEGHIDRGSTLDLGDLPVGRYGLLVRYKDEQLRATIFKIP
ncbi:MAG: hypothetical protein IPJ87_10250 [Flavobacteriales bacterium]|jgi:N-acetylneuraminic acid mutarotase|nr:hypothetical protein [Flavobacteriales bacterium]MBK7942234.1 hypothetical protein [Flavobacteriales bacterium]MBK8949035.1 hypothetical protein [Flavobacteriales bacterium]MBK9701849.1 hypothetical protein [Flavobacteriales bacterium]